MQSSQVSLYAPEFAFFLLSRVRYQGDASLRPTRHCDCVDAGCEASPTARDSYVNYYTPSSMPRTKTTPNDTNNVAGRKIGLVLLIPFFGSVPWSISVSSRPRDVTRTSMPEALCSEESDMLRSNDSQMKTGHQFVISNFLVNTLISRSYIHPKHAHKLFL